MRMGQERCTGVGSANSHLHAAVHGRCWMSDLMCQARVIPRARGAPRARARSLHLRGGAASSRHLLGTIVPSRLELKFLGVTVCFDHMTSDAGFYAGDSWLRICPELLLS